MEMSNSRYPWAGASPALFKEAYQKFVNLCKSKINSDNVKFVWSPAGEQGLENYWPGAEYVDLIGLSVYSYDQYEYKYFNRRRTFQEVFLPIYQRVEKFGKPILIAEMGVTGTDDYKIKWVENVINELNLYPRTVGFVYLNTLDPQAIWEVGLGNPDWRLPKSAKKLLSIYN